MFTRIRALVLAATLGLIVTMSPAPAAHAAALSNYWQNELIDHFLRGQTYSPPTTVYVALATSAPSAASCSGEVSGGSYARVAVTSSLANWAGTQGVDTTAASSGTSGETSNNSAITYPAPTASWGTVAYFCVFDASTGGDLLFYGSLTSSVAIGDGDAAPSFAASALTWTIS